MGAACVRMRGGCASCSRGCCYSHYCSGLWVWDDEDRGSRAVALLLGKYGKNVSSTHVAVIGDVHITRGLELPRFLLSFRAYGCDFFLVIVLVTLVDLPRVGTRKVTWTAVVRFAVVLFSIE